jgi:hypothetical protein
MMSLHRATHSSQMKTRGPEISLRTSRRRFPQKEQWKSSIKEEYCTRSAPRQAWPDAELQIDAEGGPPVSWLRRPDRKQRLDILGGGSSARAVAAVGGAG